MKKTILAITMLLLTASVAFAGTDSSKSMSVSATIVADCVVNTVGAMNFGAALGIPFTVTGTDATASSAINYTCTNTGVAPKLRLGQGSNPDTVGGSTAAAPLRRMKNGTNYISYKLCTAADCSTGVWNDTTGVTGTADGTAKSVTAYGIAAHANVPSGAYTDSVVVTIEF